MTDPSMYDRVVAAQARLRGHAHVTPVMTSATLDDRVGASVFLKCENLQRVGAFKFRGAYHAIAGLPREVQANGVLAFSSGNHAQAVACVCQLLGVSATIVMPEDAPAIKRAATEGYGAEVVYYDPATTTREELASRIATERGLHLVPPFDHVDIVAGQGTVGLELHDQVPELDAILVPCGGAGLLSGVAVATRGVRPACRVIGIEPEVADDATRSFHTGTLHRVRNPPTIADGTRTASMGEVTFPLVLEYVDDMRTVTESAIREAVRFLFYRTKLVVEPSGALGVAALLEGAVTLTGRVGVVLSGGNIDGPTMISILDETSEC